MRYRTEEIERQRENQQQKSEWTWRTWMVSNKMKNGQWLKSVHLDQMNAKKNIWIDCLFLFGVQVLCNENISAVVTYHWQFVPFSFCLFGFHYFVVVPKYNEYDGSRWLSGKRRSDQERKKNDKRSANNVQWKKNGENVLRSAIEQILTRIDSFIVLTLTPQ